MVGNAGYVLIRSRQLSHVKASIARIRLFYCVRSFAMNARISTADRATYLKIVAVALLWAILVAGSSLFLH